jgi:hypothetical protein
MDWFSLTDAQWAKMTPFCLSKRTDSVATGGDTRLFTVDYTSDELAERDVIGGQCLERDVIDEATKDVPRCSQVARRLWSGRDGGYCAACVTAGFELEKIRLQNSTLG